MELLGLPISDQMHIRQNKTCNHPKNWIVFFRWFLECNLYKSDSDISRFPTLSVPNCKVFTLQHDLCLEHPWPMIQHAKQKLSRAPCVKMSLANREWVISSVTRMVPNTGTMMTWLNLLWSQLYTQRILFWISLIVHCRMLQVNLQKIVNLKAY